MILIKIAWRNLFRQRRRTLITASAMGLSLLIAIPTYGLMEGLAAQMLRGITRMELGHVQIHDPAYPRGRALQSSLRRPGPLLQQVRDTPGVVAATPRVHGYALASHDTRLAVALLADQGGSVRFGRRIDASTPWRRDPALACEALVRLDQATAQSVTVGTVLAPRLSRTGDRCERLRIVGILARSANEAPPRPPSSDSQGRSLAPLAIYLDANDLRQAFSPASLSGEASLMHSAAIALEGVQPQHERQVTFMAEKISAGRYLSTQPRGEVVVGYRLAQVMRLEVGDALFVQAGSLDYASNSYYRDFEVVGIYRTGVEMIDRSRVFLHLSDAQQLMGLEQRVHEIALVGTNPRDLAALAASVRERVDRVRLEVTTGSPGRRAGSAPLPASVTVFEPTADGSDAELLIPYDLKRRFDDLEGVEAIARRVYAQTEVARARMVDSEIAAVPAERLPPAARQPCAVLVPHALAVRWSLSEGAILLPWPADEGAIERCPQLVARIAAPSAEPRGPAGKLLSALGPVRRSVASAAPAEPSDPAPTVPTGPVRLLVAAPATRLRLAGVETAHEPRLSDLETKISRGSYFGAATSTPANAQPADGTTAALLPERVAAQLGAQIGEHLLLRTRDDDEQTRWQAVRVAGLLRDDAWPAELPQLLLPYFAAQQIDAPRLNARAHEMLLIPRDGTAPAPLAKRAAGELVPLVRTWQRIAPDMAQLIATQDAWTGIFLLIIFAIAAMTVMNTMLMAVFERTKEFGVLKSIGMRPRQVFALITLETLSLAVMSIVVGGGIGALINHYLMTHGLDLSAYTGGFTYQGTFVDPVWRSLMTVRSVVTPSLMVGLVCLAVSFYPALRAGRLRPVEALRDRL